MRKNENGWGIDRHLPYIGIPALLNEHALEMLEKTIWMVENGWYTPDIMMELQKRFHLSEKLAIFFNNEAITTVKLQSLNEDDVKAIVEAYNNMDKLK